MGAITNLIRTAGDFFSSTEEEQFVSSRKGNVYKRNNDWHPYEEEELQLQKVGTSYSDDDDDDEGVTEDWERFFIAKRKNSRVKNRISVADVMDVYQAPSYKQAHVSYMIDDDGSVVKM